MKWIIGAVAVVLAFLAGMFVANRRFEQEKATLVQQKDKECADKIAKIPVTNWEKVDEGTRVVRLWPTIVPHWPEIAVLQLSAEKYKSLKEKPSEFLNNSHIFSKEVRPGSHCLEMVDPPSGDPDSYYAISVHKEPSQSQTLVVPANPKP